MFNTIGVDAISSIMSPNDIVVAPLTFEPDQDAP